MTLPANHVAICLIAAFQPQPNQEEVQSMALTSRTLKQAIARLDNEAVEFKEMVSAKRRPFRDTLREIVESII